MTEHRDARLVEPVFRQKLAQRTRRFTVLVERVDERVEVHREHGPRVEVAECVERLSGIDVVPAHERARMDRRDRLFLAHNGPSGLGTTPTDPWGRDFA